MPNFSITKYEVKEFDQFKFKNEQGKETPVEGKRYHLEYKLDEGAPVPSYVQILRNFQRAIEKVGGKKLYEDSINIFLKLEKDGQATWVHVIAFGSGTRYGLDIIEEEQMKQDVVADAAAMAKDIGSSGRVAVYGIYFDTNEPRSSRNPSPPSKRSPIFCSKTHP